MKYYAEIVDNHVNQVLVMNQDWSHEEIIDWLHANVSTNEWVETAMDGSIRNKYAGRGDEYKPEIDSFVTKKPFNNWVFDEDRKMYIPPLPKPLAVPLGYIVKWSQELGDWVLEKIL